MRMIDADALKEYILRSVPNWSEDREIVLDCIANSPTIEERKRGKWIDMGDFEQCSACTGTHLKEVNTVYGKAIWIKSAYCPNCGAEMEESTASNSTTDGDNSTTQKSVNTTEV